MGRFSGEAIRRLRALLHSCQPCTASGVACAAPLECFTLTGTAATIVVGGGGIIIIIIINTSVGCVSLGKVSRPPAPARRTTAVHDLDGWFDGSPFSGWHYFKIHPTILSIVFEQYRDQTVACLSAYVVPQHTHTQEGARGCCGKMLSSCSWQPNRHVCVFVKTCRKADAGPISRPHSKIGVNVRVRLFFAVNQRFASSRSRACLERNVPGTNWGDFCCFFSSLA